MSNAPPAVSVFLYQDSRLTAPPQPLTFLSSRLLLLCSPFSFMHRLWFPHALFLLLPFDFTCLCTLPVHHFDHLSNTILSVSPGCSASLKLAAQILFGNPISISPATVLFTLLLPLFHLSKVTHFCAPHLHTFHPLSLTHSFCL